MAKFMLKTELAREVLSEFMGTFMLCLINIAAPLNLLLSGTKDPFLSNMCSAVGVFLGMATAMSNSAAHINPMVSSSFAARGTFSWRKVPYFMVAQYSGAFAAAAVTYLNFLEGINKFDGGVRVFAGINGTGGGFAAIPADGVSLTTCIMDSALCSALLMFAICAVTDKFNSGVPIHLYAPLVAFCVFGIVSTFSYNCGVLMNPARDLGPRFFTMLAGYGTQGFTFQYGLFWVVAVIVPHIGGLLGTHLYDLTIGLQKPGEEERAQQDSVLLKTLSR